MRITIIFIFSRIFFRLYNFLWESETILYRYILPLFQRKRKLLKNVYPPWILGLRIFLGSRGKTRGSSAIIRWRKSFH